jgi:chaperonin GroES
MTCSLIPLDDRLVVRRLAVEAKTSGGIVLPDSAQEKPNEGVVVAVGPGTWKDGHYSPMPFEVGDRVVFGKWNGGEVVEADGGEYVLVSASTVYCKRRK